MIAVDTNVLVRLFVPDDPAQFEAVGKLFAAERIWISTTVLLEAGWVLRSVFGFPDLNIRAAITRLAGLENVTIENADALVLALTLMEHGVDFADAMHLSVLPAGMPFRTFDKDCVRGAKRAGLRDVKLVR